MDLLGDAGGFDPIAQVQENDRGILDGKRPSDFLGVGNRRDLVTGLKMPPDSMVSISIASAATGLGVTTASRSMSL